MRTILAIAVLALLTACGPRATTAPAPASAGSMTATAEASADTEQGSMGGMHRGRGMHGQDGRGQGRGMRGQADGGRGQGMQGRGEGRGMGAGMGHSAEPVADPTDPKLLEGKEVFDGVCSACHSLQPPPNLAPPMQMVSMHLRDAFDDEAGATAHILDFVSKPGADHSILPEHAVERFGLMPAQPLPEEMLEKVAAYVWWLSKPAP